ncbi:exocyst complex component EXO70H1-like [Salvia divinorum]|uniref:Exocyst subunit Exo70 family protein n=1 Tax=Salvia divinorum TaxID=28513 RepID=A0ABD1HP42_SALDI
MAEECISYNYAEYIIRKWEVGTVNLNAVSSLFLDDRNEACKLLEATIGLQHAMNHHVKLSTTSRKLVGAHELMQIAMHRLRFEFNAILSATRWNLDSESSGSQNREATATESERAVVDLKRVAECMIACGYAKECVSTYRSVRKSIVDETMYYLGIERLRSSELRKMEWKNLEMRINTWLRAVKIAVQSLFYREKVLCGAVFSSSEKVAEACFAAISRDAAADLFSFAESLCKCKKVLSPEKIFRLLDLYEAISDLWPDIELLFSEKLSAEVRSQAAVAQLKLGETVSAMLCQFEEAILKDTSPPPVGGGVHPITRYVMNFLVVLGDYDAALSNILEDWPPANVRSPPTKNRFSSPSSGGETDASTPEISLHLSWLIVFLLCKLDGKTAAYDDVALSYLYLANNLNYVVSKVRSSNLGLLVGEDWIRKLELNVKAYLTKYEKIGWSDVISAVPENPAAVTPPPKVAESLELYYARFHEACRKQRSWVIPDPKIREDVKMSLRKRILSGYRVLCSRINNMPEVIVRYTPQDLDNYLSHLFKA